ncbi:hypothetical protein Pelo_13363 [Pelomyxa schiedti]|nr:hypothetical protein Pelo_13363 [Pelomyxa schiedti]
MHALPLIASFPLAQFSTSLLNAFSLFISYFTVSASQSQQRTTVFKFLLLKGLRHWSLKIMMQGRWCSGGVLDIKECVCSSAPFQRSFPALSLLAAGMFLLFLVSPCPTCTMVPWTDAAQENGVQLCSAFLRFFFSRIQTSSMHFQHLPHLAPTCQSPLLP